MTQTSNTKQDAAKRNPGFGIYAFLCEDYQDRAINEDAARRCREWEEAISSEVEGPFYLRRPFSREPDFDVASENRYLHALLRRAVAPEETL